MAADHSAGAFTGKMTMLVAPNGSEWWTCGFEAYGQVDEVDDLLATTVTGINARKPPQLQPGLPAGYPHWLALLANSP